LLVRISDGPVAREYAPAALIGQVAERVFEVLHDIGGGWSPMLYGVLPASSMELYFGDPSADEAQRQLPADITLSHAITIAKLIDLDGEDLFTEAIRIGAPVRSYERLVHFVETEGITLSWQPRGQVARQLTPTRAARQFARLSVKGETREQGLTINGVLYRVITEVQHGHRGTVGIHLHSWSAKPPHRQHRVIAAYDDSTVEAAIKAGLIGEPVEVRLVIRQPVPGTAIDTSAVDLIVEKIGPGDPEGARLGIPIVWEDGEAEE
jgi:hypothetical protein